MNKFNGDTQHPMNKSKSKQTSHTQAPSKRKERPHTWGVEAKDIDMDKGLGRREHSGLLYSTQVHIATWIFLKIHMYHSLLSNTNFTISHNFTTSHLAKFFSQVICTRAPIFRWQLVCIYHFLQYGPPLVHGGEYLNLLCCDLVQ
jgi:hypothetical protein